MGAGFCSLYRKILYIEVHYIKVWVYIVIKAIGYKWHTLQQLRGHKPLSLSFCKSAYGYGPIAISQSFGMSFTLYSALK